MQVLKKVSEKNNNNINKIVLAIQQKHGNNFAVSTIKAADG